MVNTGGSSPPRPTTSSEQIAEACLEILREYYPDDVRLDGIAKRIAAFVDRHYEDRNAVKRTIDAVLRKNEELYKRLANEAP